MIRRTETVQSGFPVTPIRSDTKSADKAEMNVRRLRSLDMLRGIAVLMVLVVHAPLPADWNALWIVERLFSLGSYGVDLFFVLSGFLISSLLFSELEYTGAINLSRFWLRRGLKIWPSYYAAYGTMLILQYLSEIKQGKEPSVIYNYLLQAIPNAVFLQNYIWTESRWFASWSLAVEEHFYLLLPLSLIILSSITLKGRQPIHILLIICLIPLFLRLYTVLLSENTSAGSLVYIQTHYRADSLCFGVLLSWINHKHRAVITKVAQKWKWLLILLFLALATPFCFPYGRKVTETVGFTLLYIAFGGLVTMAIAKPDWANGTWAPIRLLAQGLAWVGTYSYTIYLAHAVANLRFGFGRIEREMPLGGAYINWGLFIAGSILGGILLSHIIERPFLSLRDKWIPGVRPEKPSLTVRLTCQG